MKVNIKTIQAYASGTPFRVQEPHSGFWHLAIFLGWGTLQSFSKQPIKIGEEVCGMAYSKELISGQLIVSIRDRGVWETLTIKQLALMYGLNWKLEREEDFIENPPPFRCPVCLDNPSEFFCRFCE